MRPDRHPDAPGCPLDRFASWSRVVSDRDAVVDRLDALIRHQTVGIVVGTCWSIQPVAVKGDQVRWRVDRNFGATAGRVEFEGYNALLSMELETLTRVDDELYTHIPRALQEVRRRWFRRVVPPDELNVRVFDEAGRSHAGRVINLSYGGLRVELPGPPAAPFAVGCQIPVVEVSGHRGSVSLACDVVLYRGHASYVQLGLSIESAHPDGEWRRWIDELLHPRARDGGKHDAEAQWRLFERCGYFALSEKSPEDFTHLRRAYLDTSAIFARASDLARQVVWAVEAAPEVTATATVLKVYDGTWLGVHMAKDRGDGPDGTPGRQVLRELNYRIYEQVQLDPSLRWFFTSIQDRRVWTRRVFHDFPRTLSDSGDVAIVRFRALELSSRTAAAGPRRLGVRLASEDDLDALCHHIDTTRPPAYAEALDLVRSRIEMRSNAALWAREGLSRERVVLVAMASRRAQAAAVVERAPDGVHLFGLLDLVRLYDLSGRGQDGFSPLLQTAADYFARAGKERFVCYLESGLEVETSIVDAATDLGAADMCIIAAKRIPEILENIHRVAAP